MNLLNNKPVDDSHLEEIAKRDLIIKNYEDSLRISKNRIDSLNKGLDNARSIANNISRDLRRSEEELRKVKGSLKDLTNDELVVEANKMYGGPDTTELTILLSRPTTEFLVEEAKKIEVLTKAFEFSKSLNRNYQEQINLYAASIDQHVKDKDNLRGIIEAKDDQFEIKGLAYDNLNKKYKKQRFWTKVGVGIGIGLLTYGIVK